MTSLQVSSFLSVIVSILGNPVNDDGVQFYPNIEKSGKGLIV